MEGYAVEATKLGERLASAEAQYVDGMRKVKAANRQLQYLQSEVAGSEATAQSKCTLLCSAVEHIMPCGHDAPISSLYTCCRSDQDIERIVLC